MRDLRNDGGRRFNLRDLLWLWNFRDFWHLRHLGHLRHFQLWHFNLGHVELGHVELGHLWHFWGLKFRHLRHFRGLKLWHLWHFRGLKAWAWGFRCWHYFSARSNNIWNNRGRRFNLRDLLWLWNFRDFWHLRHLNLRHFNLGHFRHLRHFELWHFNLGHVELGHVELGHLWHFWGLKFRHLWHFRGLKAWAWGFRCRHYFSTCCRHLDCWVAFNDRRSWRGRFHLRDLLWLWLWHFRAFRHVELGQLELGHFERRRFSTCFRRSFIRLRELPIPLCRCHTLQVNGHVPKDKLRSHLHSLCVSRSSLSSSSSSHPTSEVQVRSP